VYSSAAMCDVLFKLGEDALMDPVTEVCDRDVCGWEDDRLGVVRDLPPRLGVHADQVEVFPDLFKQPVQVPVVWSEAAVVVAR
jgi:hypothetical protein